MMDKKRKKVEQYIEQYQMIGRGDRIVTGVSGGADSVCLLFVLCELRKKLGFEVIVCHVNHQLRAEAAEQDEAYVEELCRKLDVPFRIFHENVELIAKNGKKSLEEAGRIVRRNAFETVCRESGANKIATAHHKNDNAETVLLNLARGSGLQGMCGIRPVYGKRIRPLLCLTRKEIEEWLEEEQISYCTDETNEEDEYTRNRIRHKILPVMEQEINRQTVEHINSLSLQAEEIWEYLNLQTDAAWRQTVHPVDSVEGLRIEETGYAELPGVLQSLLIRRCICEMAEAQKDIEAVHIEAVRGLFNRQVGKSRDLPYQLRAVRTYAGVEIGRRFEDKDWETNQKTNQKKDQEKDQEKECAGRQSVELRIPGETYFPGTGQKVCCEICGREEAVSGKELPQKSYTKCFDYDIIKSGLCIRYRRPGDELVIDSRGKRQKLKSYFINEKVPKEERDRMLLIAEEEQIVWIPGMRMSAAYQIGDQTTKILKIKIVEE
nr:tRNA lysidine(34) synthetase TilS [uncultured Mediterraneibacter sp.]